MSKFNIKSKLKIDQIYQQGLLPQRNNKQLYYQQSSCRCQIKNLVFNSENRRIFRKTDQFSYQLLPLSQFQLKANQLNQIYSWSQAQQWDFPKSSIKNVFTNHIFNYLYIWRLNQQIVGLAICLFDSNFSHLAYVFFDPSFDKQYLPIRMCLQAIGDSASKKLTYCYLGRFDPNQKIGYYKRNFPNLQIYNYQHKQWQHYST